MSDFKELVKSFPKTREYVRDFFVYGFKTREEFGDKSPRTYDNERRRLESWLAPYVRKDYVKNGSNISLAIDSNLLDTNPLFQVWKTKSFTDNDIVLHFLILDLLQNGDALTAEEITNELLLTYDVLFDTQTVRRKCNAYEKEGLLNKKKDGKNIVYFLDNSLMNWFSENSNILDAISFYQMAECFGIVGNTISDQLDFHNDTFRIKHSFSVHTLEDEILFALINAMNKKVRVNLLLKSAKKNTVTDNLCIPLQIFTSTRTGRRFLCCYIEKSKRFTCMRLDNIKNVTLLAPAPDYDELRNSLDKNRIFAWGVSFQSENDSRLDKLTMQIQVVEPAEDYIINRLKKEGRGGTITRISKGIYQYEIEVFDSNEMLPWLRTFIGRIVSLECTNKAVERRFYRDLNTMYKRYGISGEAMPPQDT